MFTAENFQTYEKLEYKKNKLKLVFDFLKYCKQLAVSQKFLIFKLPNFSNKYALSICKILLRSAINNRNRKLQHFWKELALSENVLSKQISTIDFYSLTKSTSSPNKKLLQKLLYTEKRVIFPDERNQLTYIHS